MNNRRREPHQPFRRRERAMPSLPKLKHCSSLPVHASVHNPSTRSAARSRANFNLEPRSLLAEWRGLFEPQRIATDQKTDEFAFMFDNTRVAG
jgi:hypothetical protein